MKPNVAFICVHNSCRSQMAEAISNKLASDVYQAYSAGTETKPVINQDAVKIIQEYHGIDMNLTQKSKLIDALPNIDIVITMGCNVNCPFIESKHREDWGLEDPTGKPLASYIETMHLIEHKIEDLKQRILNHKL
ncbi:MAG: arsenate reductase ArsC [Acholeplasma sp.]|nr:arsenate reductase ArsC [Acholeplasma sp.]